MATSSEKTVDDVSKPGTTSADATSKPVIVTHKTLAKDPMLSSATEGTDAAKLASPSTGHKNIAPSKDFTNLAEDKPDTQPPASSEEAEVDTLAGQVSTKKEKQLAESEEAEQRLAIDKLVADKTYFVPIAPTQKKRTARLILFTFLVIATLAAGFYFAASAGVIPGVEVPPLPLYNS